MEHRPSKILRCFCEHEYQDKKYGKKNRVHNWGPMCSNRNPGYRCTVCGQTRD